MTLPELVRWLAPEIRDVPDDDINNALVLAEDYRPRRLKRTKADQAVAWYAAYLISLREHALPKQDGVAEAAIGMQRAGIKSEQIADDRRDFVSGAEAEALQADPLGYLARYNAIKGKGGLLIMSAGPGGGQ